MAISHRLKQAIRREYNFKCQYCDNNSQPAIHVEHIIAKDNNGSDDLDNLTLSCERCNLKKSNLKLPIQYSGILLARAKQKRKKIEERLLGRTSEIIIHNTGDIFLKINTTKDQIDNFSTLYKCQSKIVHNYIEYQTYQWCNLFGEQFHQTFKNMMCVNIGIFKCVDHSQYQKITSENLITGIRYEVNEYVKLYLSERLIQLIKSCNNLFEFRDILYGKELENIDKKYTYKKG